MKSKVIAGFFIFFCILSSAAVQGVNAASCPSTDKYAMLNYNHQLLNQTETFSEASRVLGFVGLKIGPSGITNAGNNILQRTVEVQFDPTCSSRGESDVTVTVSGSCANGVLNMRIQEVYPEITLSGCLTFVVPETSTDFILKMDYADGNTEVQPYTCPNCSGTYSWRLQFTEGPPSESLPLAPLVPMLHLLQKKTR